MGFSFFFRAAIVLFLSSFYFAIQLEAIEL
jgi:hypothetical protein